jgi:hypothetical protein
MNLDSETANRSLTGGDETQSSGGAFDHAWTPNPTAYGVECIIDELKARKSAKGLRPVGRPAAAANKTPGDLDLFGGAYRRSQAPTPTTCTKVPETSAITSTRETGASRLPVRIRTQARQASRRTSPTVLGLHHELPASVCSELVLLSEPFSLFPRSLTQASPAAGCLDGHGGLRTLPWGSPSRREHRTPPPLPARPPGKPRKCPYIWCLGHMPRAAALGPAWGPGF